MRFVNFENTEALNELLDRIGITTTLGEFLAEHLTQVLRKQHSDVVIEAIELVKSHACSVEGRRASDGVVMSVTSFCMPVDTRVVLVSNNRGHELDLHIRIVASAADGRCDIKTDVIVQNQRSL